jgi:hypothetical protein
MESKKDIGNYFKENLEPLDYSPSLKVWEGIEVELKKKKKIRFIFWMFFAVIGVLGSSTYIYLSHSNSLHSSRNEVVTSASDTDKRNSNNSDYKNSDSSHANQQNTSLSNSKNEIRKKNESVDDGKSKISENNLNENTNSGTNNLDKEVLKNKHTKSTEPSTKVVNNYKKTKKNLLEKPNKSSYKNRIKSDKSASSISLNGLSDTRKNNSLDALKAVESNFKSTSEKEKFNLDDLKNTDTNPIVTSDNNKKLSLEDLKKTNQIKRDSLVAARKTEKEKKDILQQPKEEEKDSTKTEIADSSYEIIIAPYFGYNYNGNLGNGNFLNNNTTSKKDSQFQSTYGVLVRLMGSEKAGIQTGIGIINATYSATFKKTTNNFINPQNVSLEIPLSDINQLFPSNDTINTIVTATNKLSFIEVPLEGYYVFADKKFGFAAAGGISFMISQKKDLFLESDNVERLRVGELKNILPFSVTGNIKLNLFYKISSRLQFDLYPEFQYHLMEFKEVSNYHSYYFSIKTGLSYKL